jgi:hypothetical protein
MEGSNEVFDVIVVGAGIEGSATIDVQLKSHTLSNINVSRYSIFTRVISVKIIMNLHLWFNT